MWIGLGSVIGRCELKKVWAGLSGGNLMGCK
jgi:hypothetical protein